MSNTDEEQRVKHGLVQFTPGQPMRLHQEGVESSTSLSQDQRAWLEALGTSMLAYIDAVQELLKGRYKNLKNQAPRYLAEPSSIFAVHCKDGIIIRYDVKKDDKQPEKQARILAGISDETVTQLAPKISESVIYCHPSPDFESLIPEHGPEITVAKADATSSHQEIIFRAKVGISVVTQNPSASVSEPPAKPRPIVSVRSSFELDLIGETLPGDYSTEKRKQFLLRNKMRLPVGWECIELFSPTNITQWKAEYARVWAENDLLASIVADQFREEQFRNLDPNATARKKLAKLLNEYKRLLDSRPEREEILQTFLEANPALLCPAHTAMKPKLQIGNRVTDFVFGEASGDYVLVELERSTSPLFTKGGDANSQLNHARSQILDWRRYIEDNLRTVQEELDLPGISANPRGLIVIGRSSSLSPENRRRLVSIENESPKTKILTYDGVFDNAKAIVENLLGPLWLGAGIPEVYYLRS